MTDKFYITTPIYYVNDKPHIGHAYCSIACDVLARFMRLSGKQVHFLTGTDEHGQKVQKSAAAAGIDPQTFTDQVSQHFRDLTKTLNLTNDDFIRTTEPRHKKGAQELWRRMQKNGHISLGSYGGWYAVRDEAYYAESELVDGKAPTGADVEWVEESSYFFDLSKWQDRLLKFYDEHPDFILPHSRRNEVISFVKGGLKDLSISRTTFDWGIPVPDCAKASSGKPGDLPPEALAQGGKHIMYVWLDALANYITALGFPDESAPLYKNFWPASLHMVGKDILRFHAVYWPAFLMAADLPVPQRLFATGWWTSEGQKISKSLGNAIDPLELITEYGLDQLRYFLLREVPFGQDGDFSRERLKIVINSELANTIGNLAQRTLAMIQKNCDSKVPDAGIAPLDLAFLDEMHVTQASTPKEIEAKYYACEFSSILTSILEKATLANVYIDQKAPWKQKKIDEKLMQATLYHLAEGIRCIAIMLQPFMPEASVKILVAVGYPEEVAKTGIGFDKLAPEHALKPGTPLPAPSPIFPKIETTV